MTSNRNRVAFFSMFTKPRFHYFPFHHSFGSASAGSPSAFPQTGILDDFNRADGPLGSNWEGVVNVFRIANQQLQPVLGGNAID